MTCSPKIRPENQCTRRGLLGDGVGVRKTRLLRRWPWRREETIPSQSIYGGVRNRSATFGAVAVMERITMSHTVQHRFTGQSRTHSGASGHRVLRLAMRCSCNEVKWRMTGLCGDWGGRGGKRDSEGKTTVFQHGRWINMDEGDENKSTCA